MQIMQMNTKQWWRIIGVCALGALVGLGVSFLIWGTAPAQKVLVKTYENKDLAITFSYPGSYILSEQEDTIVLFENAPVYNQASSSDISIERTSDIIAIEILGSGLEADIAQWVQDNATSSHFAISDKTFESALVANKKIISYAWTSKPLLDVGNSGEMNGTTIALIHNGRVFLVSVVYNEDSEKIQDNFISLLSTVQFL